MLHGRLAGHRANTMAKGLRGALEGTSRSAGSMLKERWAGPEHVVPEQVGRFFGGKLRDLNPGQRYRALKKLRKAVAMTPELHHTPLFEDIVPAVNRALATPLPKPGAVQAQSFASKAAPYLGVPAAAVTEPGSLVHLGVNRLRSAIAESPFGRKFMRRTAQDGFTSTPVGEAARTALEMPKPTPLSRAKEIATDVFISPAALDAHRIGTSIGNLASQPGGVQKVKKIQGALEPMTHAGARLKSGLEAGGGAAGESLQNEVHRHPAAQALYRNVSSLIK
jgi:hypothetical protein